MIFSILAAPAPETPSGVFAAIIVAIISTLGTLGAGWYTYRSAKNNAAQTKDVEKDRLATESWREQVSAWRADVVTLRGQRAEDREEYEAKRAEDRAEYEAKLNSCSEQIAKLTDRLDSMVEKHEVEKTVLEDRINALVVWGRQVVAIMSEHGIAFPPPPPGHGIASASGT